jgi:bacillopeptidase F (M6 metalloprotease family)
LIADPDFETAYRSDVQRIETKGKMAIKETDEIKRDEEFVNVETPYKKVRQVMLQKKFETLFRDRAAAEQADQRRW